MDPQGIQLNGNPTGGGESHLYIKPNINLLGQHFGQAAPPKEPNNVQVSYGDGKSTATQQLQVRPFLHWFPSDLIDVIQEWMHVCASLGVRL